MSPELFLKSLQIRNIATFDNQTIEFSHKFNAIVGETGSGKSLILDSLQLVFGGRADKKIVRKGSEYAMVEAIFQTGSSEINQWLIDQGHPIENDEIVVKRLIYPNGPSKAWLNFQSCPINLLQSFSRRYIDLVGQFENQKLLSSTYLLRLLDQFAKHESKVDRFQNDYHEWQASLQKLAIFKDELASLIQQEDYMRFQLKEIEELDPSLDDEKMLLLKKNASLNQEKHQKILARSQARLSGEDDYSIINQLNLLVKDLENFPLIEATTFEALKSAQAQLSDVDYALGSIDLDSVAEEELDTIIERLDKYQRLKRKFGGDLEGVLSAYEKLKHSKNDLDSLQNTIKDLEKAANKQVTSLNTQANHLHDKRIEMAKALSKELTQEVQLLNMKGATIKLELNKGEALTLSGLSLLDFLAETNPGEGFYRVQEVASGGELSRILLGLRQVLSSKDSISVFLFDEIDAGVGGETALKIGKSLAKVSHHSQVIAITHLPQIAIHADHLVHVSKETIENDGKRTQSTVKAIAPSEHRRFIEAMTPLN